MDLVTTTTEGPVRIISFNRPDQRNAYNADLHTEYLDALEEADKSSAIRAIVVTGRGTSFSAGADFKRLKNIAEHGWTPYRDPRPVHFPLSLSTPTIAAVNGPAVGMGLVTAMYCDLRVATESAVFTAGFARLGLVAEHGLSWLVPHAVGLSVANELLLSSRPMTAERAHQVGLVMAVEPSVDDMLETALQFGHELSQLSPKALAATKRQLIRHSSETFTTAMSETHSVMQKSLHGADFKEGLAALFEKRRAEFLKVNADEYITSLDGVFSAG